MWQRKEVPFDCHGSHIAQENTKTAMAIAISPAAGLDMLEGMPPGCFQLIDALLSANLYPEMSWEQRLWLPTVIQIDSDPYADEVCQRTTDRPESPEEADALLHREFDAFRFSPRSSSTLYICFTKSSLARRCGLHLSEADDFIEHLKSQGLIENRTYPVTFSHSRQKRYTCIPASGGNAND